MKCHDWIFLIFTTIICCTATISIAQAQQRGRVKFALAPQKDEADPIPSPDAAPKPSRPRSSAPRASSRFRATEQPAVQAPAASVESKETPRTQHRSSASRSRSEDRSSRKLDAEATELAPSIRSRKRVNSVSQNPIPPSDQPTKVQLPTANIDRANIIRRGKTRSEAPPTSASPPSVSQTTHLHFRRRSDGPAEESTESVRKVRNFSSRSVTSRADDEVSSELPVIVTTAKNNWRNAGGKRGSAKAKISERLPKSLDDEQLEDENYPEHFKLLLKKQKPTSAMAPRNLSRPPVSEDPSYSRSNEVYDSTKSPARQRRLEHASQESSDEILQVSRAIPKVRRVELKREDTARAALKSRRVEPPAEEVTKSESVAKAPLKSRRTEPQLEALKFRRNDLSAEELSPKREETSRAPFKSRRNEPQTDAKPNEILEATKPSKPLFVPRRAEPYRPKPTTTTPRSTTTLKSSRRPEALEARQKYKPRVNARLQFPTLKTKITSEDVSKGENEIANVKPSPHPIRPPYITKSTNLALDTPLVDSKKTKSPKFSSRYRGDAYSRYQPKTESSKPVYTPTIPAVSTEPTPLQTELPSSRTAKSVNLYNPENAALINPPNDMNSGVVFDEIAGVWNMIEPVAGGLTRSDISVDSSEEHPLQPSSTVTVSIFEALADILTKTPPTTSSTLTSTTTTTTTTTTSTTELPEIIQVPELKIDSMQMSSTTVNTHLITDVDDENTTTTNEITNNDRNGRILNNVDINQKQSTTTASNDPTEPTTVPQYIATITNTNTSPPLTTQTEQTTENDLTDSTLSLAPTTQPTFTNIPTNFSANSFELTTLASNPPTSLPMPFLADALTTPGSSLITRPQLISAISTFLDTSVQNASETMATSTTTTTTTTNQTTTATLDTDTEQSTTSDASTTLSPPPTTTLTPSSTDTPPVTISFLDLFTIQPKKVNSNTEQAIEVHPIYKEPDPYTTPVSRQQKTFIKEQTTGRPVNILTFLGTRTYPSISVTGGTSTDRIEELTTAFFDSVTSGVTTDSPLPLTTSREQDSTTYTTPQSTSRTQSLPIHLNSILGSTQKYDQNSPSKTVHTTESTTTVRSRFGNNRLPILPAGSVPIRNNTTTSTTSTTSTTKTTSSSTKTTTTTTTAETVTQTSPKQQQQQQLSNFIPDQQVPKPIKDFSVYGILPNNTVVRKRPSQVSRTLDVGLMVYGILPNRTVVRKYPNGTLAIVDSTKDVEVVDIDPQMLFNPFSELYRTSQSSLLLTTHRSTTSQRLIEGNRIVASSSLGSNIEIPTSTTTRWANSIKDATDSGSTEATTTNSDDDDENLIQLLSENEDNLLNSTSLVEANTENAVLLDLLKRKYINSDITSRSSNVVSLTTTARNVIMESPTPANRDKDVSGNTLSDFSEEKRKDFSSSSSEEDLLGKLFPGNGSTGPNRSNTDDDNVISHHFDTFANIGSIFTGNKGRALEFSQRTKLYPIKLVMASQNTRTKLFPIHTSQSAMSVKNDSRFVIEAFSNEANRTHGVSAKSSVDGSKTLMPLRDGGSKMIDFGVFESEVDSKVGGVYVVDHKDRFEGMGMKGEFFEASGDDGEATTEAEKDDSDAWKYPPDTIPERVMYSNDYEEFGGNVGGITAEMGSGDFDTPKSTFMYNPTGEVSTVANDISLNSTPNLTTTPTPAAHHPIGPGYDIPVEIVYPEDYFEQLPKYLEHFAHTSTTIGPISKNDDYFSKIVHQSTSISTTTSSPTNSDDSQSGNVIFEPKLSQSDQHNFSDSPIKTLSTKNVVHSPHSNPDESVRNDELLTSTISSEMSGQFLSTEDVNNYSTSVTSSDNSFDDSSSTVVHQSTNISTTTSSPINSDDSQSENVIFEPRLSKSDNNDSPDSSQQNYSEILTSDVNSDLGHIKTLSSKNVVHSPHSNSDESVRSDELLTSTISSEMSGQVVSNEDINNYSTSVTSSDNSSDDSSSTVVHQSTINSTTTSSSTNSDVYQSENVILEPRLSKSDNNDSPDSSQQNYSEILTSGVHSYLWPVKTLSTINIVHSPHSNSDESVRSDELLTSTISSEMSGQFVSTEDINNYSTSVTSSDNSSSSTIVYQSTNISTTTSSPINSDVYQSENVILEPKLSQSDNNDSPDSSQQNYSEILTSDVNSDLGHVKTLSTKNVVHSPHSNSDESVRSDRLLTSTISSEMSGQFVSTEDINNYSTSVTSSDNSSDDSSSTIVYQSTIISTTTSSPINSDVYQTENVILEPKLSQSDQTNFSDSSQPNYSEILTSDVNSDLGHIKTLSTKNVVHSPHSNSDESVRSDRLLTSTISSEMSGQFVSTEDINNYSTSVTSSDNSSDDSSSTIVYQSTIISTTTSSPINSDVYQTENVILEPKLSQSDQTNFSDSSQPNYSEILTSDVNSDLGHVKTLSTKNVVHSPHSNSDESVRSDRLLTSTISSEMSGQVVSNEDINNYSTSVTSFDNSSDDSSSTVVHQSTKNSTTTSSSTNSNVYPSENVIFEPRLSKSDNNDSPDSSQQNYSEILTSGVHSDLWPVKTLSTINIVHSPHSNSDESVRNDRLLTSTISSEMSGQFVSTEDINNYSTSVTSSDNSSSSTIVYQSTNISTTTSSPINSDVYQSENAILEPKLSQSDQTNFSDSSQPNYSEILTSDVNSYLGHVKTLSTKNVVHSPHSNSDESVRSDRLLTSTISSEMSGQFVSTEDINNYSTSVTSSDNSSDDSSSTIVYQSTNISTTTSSPINSDVYQSENVILEPRLSKSDNNDSPDSSQQNYSEILTSDVNSDLGHVKTLSTKNVVHSPHSNSDESVRSDRLLTSTISSEMSGQFVSTEDINNYSTSATSSDNSSDDSSSTIVYQSTNISTTTSSPINSDVYQSENVILEPKLSQSDQTNFSDSSQPNYSEILTSDVNSDLGHVKTLSTKNVVHSPHSNSDESVRSDRLLTSTISSEMSGQFVSTEDVNNYSTSVTISDNSSDDDSSSTIVYQSTSISTTTSSPTNSEDSQSENVIFEPRLSNNDSPDSSQQNYSEILTSDVNSDLWPVKTLSTINVVHSPRSNSDESVRNDKLLASTISSKMSDQFVSTENANINTSSVIDSDTSSKNSAIKIGQNPNSLPSDMASYTRSKILSVSDDAESDSNSHSINGSISDKVFKSSTENYSSSAGNDGVYASSKSSKMYDKFYSRNNELDSTLMNVFKNSHILNKSADVTISNTRSKMNPNDFDKNKQLSRNSEQEPSVNDFLGNYDTGSVENVLVKIETDFDDENPMHDSSTTKASNEDHTGLEDEGLIRLTNVDTSIHTKSTTESTLFNSVFSSEFDTVPNNNESKSEFAEFSKFPNSEEKFNSGPIFENVDWVTWATVNRNTSSMDFGDSNSGLDLYEAGGVPVNNQAKVDQKSESIDVKNKSINLEQSSEIQAPMPNANYSKVVQRANSSNNFELSSQTSTEATETKFDLSYSDSSEDENLQEKLQIVAKVELSEQLSGNSSLAEYKTESGINQSVKNAENNQSETVLVKAKSSAIVRDSIYDIQDEVVDKAEGGTSLPVSEIGVSTTFPQFYSLPTDLSTFSGTANPYLVSSPISDSTSNNTFSKPDVLLPISEENSTVSEYAQRSSGYPKNPKDSKAGFSLLDYFEYLNSFSSTKPTFGKSSENKSAPSEVSFEQISSVYPQTELQIQTTHVSDTQETSTERIVEMQNSSPKFERHNNLGQWSSTTDIHSSISVAQMTNPVFETTTVLNLESRINKSSVKDNSDTLPRTDFDSLSNSEQLSTTTESPSHISTVQMLEYVSIPSTNKEAIDGFSDAQAAHFMIRPKSDFDIRSYHKQSTGENKITLNEDSQHSALEQSSEMSVQSSNENDDSSKVEVSAESGIDKISSDLEFKPNFLESPAYETTFANQSHSKENSKQSQNSFENFEQSSEISANRTLPLDNLVTEKSEDENSKVIQNHNMNLEQSSKMYERGSEIGFYKTIVTATPEIEFKNLEPTTDPNFDPNILEIVKDPATSVNNAMRKHFERGQNFSISFRSGLHNSLPEMLSEKQPESENPNTQNYSNNFDQNSKIPVQIENMPFHYKMLMEDIDEDDTDLDEDPKASVDENLNPQIERKVETSAQVKVSDHSTDDKSFLDSTTTDPLSKLVTEIHSEYTQPPAVYYPMSMAKMSKAAPAVKATFVMPTNMQAVVESPTEASRVAMVFPKNAKPQLNEALPGHFHKMYTEEGLQKVKASDLPVNVMYPPSVSNENLPENKPQSVNEQLNLTAATVSSKIETASALDRLFELPKKLTFSKDKSSSKFDLTALVPKDESEPIFVSGGITLRMLTTPGDFFEPETKPTSSDQMFVPGGVPQDLLFTTEAYSEAVPHLSSESPFAHSTLDETTKVYTDTESSLSLESVSQGDSERLSDVKIPHSSSNGETKKILEKIPAISSSSKLKGTEQKYPQFDSNSQTNNSKPFPELEPSSDNNSIDKSTPLSYEARQEVTNDEFKAYKMSLNFLESALEKVEYEVKDLKENFQKTLNKSSTHSPPISQEKPRDSQDKFQEAVENEVERHTSDTKQFKQNSQTSLGQQVPSEPSDISQQFYFQSEYLKTETSTSSNLVEETTDPTHDNIITRLPTPQYLISNPQPNTRNSIQQSNTTPSFVHQMSENALANMQTINSTMSGKSSNISISEFDPSLMASLKNPTAEENLSDSDQNHSATTSISKMPQLSSKVDMESWIKSTPPEVLYMAMNPAVEAQTRNHTETQYTTHHQYTNFHESSTISSLDNNIVIDNLKNSINTITEPKRIDSIPTTPVVFVVTPGTTSSTTTSTTIQSFTTPTTTTTSSTTPPTTTTTTTSAPSTTMSTTMTTPVPTTVPTTPSTSTTTASPQTAAQPNVAIGELEKNIKLLQQLLGLQASLKSSSSTSSSTSSSSSTTTTTTPLPPTTKTTTTSTTTNKAAAGVDDVNFVNTLRQLLLAQQQETKKATTSTTTTTISTTPKTTTAVPITISPQNLEDLLNSFSTPSFSTTPKSNDQDDIAFLNSLRDIGKLRVTTSSPPTFANRIIELALQNRQATPTPMSPVYIPARVTTTTTPAFTPLPNVKRPAIPPPQEIERHRQDQASLSADLSLLSTLLGRRITAEDLPQITQQFGGNKQSVSAPRRPTTTPRTTPRTTKTTTTTEKPMSRDEIAEIEKNLNLLSSLLGRPVSLNELPLIMQDLRSGRKTSGTRINQINAVNAKTTTTTFRPRPTVSVQSQTPISQEEVIELLKDPSSGVSPDQLNIYGKSNDAVLAAVLKQRGIGPTNNNIPINDLFLQGPTSTPYHTTRAPRPPPQPPATQRRPLLDGLAWLWRTWQDTAPGTRPSRNNRQPVAAASTRLESPLAIGVFGGAQPAPPATSNSGEGGEYAELQYPQNPNPSFGQGNGLLTAAFGVTRMVTQFLGAAFQGAAKSVQTAFSPQAVQQNSLIGLSG